MKAKMIRHLVLALAFAVTPAFGHPNTIPHSHTSTSIEWELDVATGGTEDGSTAHNHLWPRSFGANQWKREPYSADGCWDGDTWRNDENPIVFTEGHCYVDSGMYSTEPITYRFVSSSMPNSAKDRLRQAFQEWSDLSSPFTTIFPHGKNGFRVNLEFEEVTSNAKINIYWENQAGANGGGYWTDSASNLHFDSSMNWDYSNTLAGVDNSKWHFLSVALHEVGHSIGLEHQLDYGDDIMAPSVGAPGSSTGSRNLWFDIDDDSAHGVYELYGIAPPPPPPDLCEIHISWVCENNSPRAIVTPTLTGFTMSNIDLEYQLSGSSNWYPIYQGAPTCPLYNPPSTFMSSVVSALITTAAGHVTGCTIPAIPIWCGSGDPL